MSHRPRRFKSDLNFAIEKKLREAGNRDSVPAARTAYPQRIGSHCRGRSSGRRRFGCEVNRPASPTPASLRLASAYLREAATLRRCARKSCPLGQRRKISHCAAIGPARKTAPAPVPDEPVAPDCPVLRAARASSGRCSIFSGSVWRVSRSRCESRTTWVSTTMPSSFPKALPSTTLAVFRPTPGQRVQLLHRVGNAARHASATMAAAAARMLLALLRKKPVERIRPSSVPARRARRNPSLSGIREERRRDEVHPLVGALRGENRGDEQLERSCESPVRNARPDRLPATPGPAARPVPGSSFRGVRMRALCRIRGRAPWRS